MKKIIIFFSLMVLYGINCQTLYGQSQSYSKIKTDEKGTSINYTYKLIPSLNATWGYDIYKGNKVFIHQTSIPSLPGNEGFKSKSNAEKVALLVIAKIKNGEMPPSVSEDELKTLKVLQTK